MPIQKPGQSPAKPTESTESGAAGPTSREGQGAGAGAAAAKPIQHRKALPSLQASLQTCRDAFDTATTPAEKQRAIINYCHFASTATITLSEDSFDLEKQLNAIHDLKTNCLAPDTKLPEGLTKDQLFEEQHGTHVLDQFFSIHTKYGSQVPSEIVNDRAEKFINSVYITYRSNIIKHTGTQNIGRPAMTQFLFLMPPQLGEKTDLEVLEIGLVGLKTAPSILAKLSKLKNLQMVSTRMPFPVELLKICLI